MPKILLCSENITIWFRENVRWKFLFATSGEGEGVDSFFGVKWEMGFDPLFSGTNHLKKGFAAPKSQRKFFGGKF